MLRRLFQREYVPNRRLEEKSLRNVVATRIPLSLKERAFHGIEGFDKIFAVAWISSTVFAVGTKDNRLVVWDAISKRHVQIELPPPGRPRKRQNENCGIHSISINPSRTLLATGGGDPDDVAIFLLPSFEPMSLLSKHEDWIFASDWVSDKVLATCSRDTSVKLWCVQEERDCFVVDEPVVSKVEHKDKVRDLKYSPTTDRLVSLSQDETCKIWDPHVMEVVHTVRLSYKKELVCLAVEAPLIAVGSQRHITLVDMRCSHEASHINSKDENNGVRSLSFKDNILTCGGGGGRISFFDLRKESYIPLDSSSPPLSSNAGTVKANRYRACYITGKGFLERNEVYMSHFDGHNIANAVYAHAYDSSGTQLLVGGGPLPYGLKGCYLAVW